VKTDVHAPVSGWYAPVYPWASSVLLVLVWVAAAAIAFSLKPGNLLSGLDGGYMRELARRQFEWQVPLFIASIDFFQGIGDTFFPVNFRLFPGFAAASPLGSSDAAKVVTYAIIVTEMSIGVLTFGRALAVSRTVGIAAALLTCLLVFPFYGLGLIYPIAVLAPHIESLVAAALVIAAGLLQYGRRDWLIDLPFALLMFATIAWAVSASVVILLLAAPLLLLCGISGIVAAQTTRERLAKVGLGMVTVVLLIATGPMLYLIGQLIDTAAILFPRELENNRATFIFASILFHWNTVGPAGPLLVIMAIAGSVLAIFDHRLPTLRVFAITLLTYLCSRLTFAVLTIIFDFWRGPSPLYFEFFVMPLYAVFAMYSAARAVEAIWRWTGWRAVPSLWVDGGLVVAAAVLAISMAAATPSQDLGFHYPPEHNSFTRLIAEQSSIHGGAEFKGRTVNMTGRRLDRAIGWLDLHERDALIARETGTDMRIIGLSYFSIPSMFQYTSTITPAFYAITSRLLARHDDIQQRSVSVLREINPKILAMLGIRYVITDAPFNGGAELRDTIPLKDNNSTLYLYEIARSNLGDYSPTQVIKLETAAEIVARLRSAHYDPMLEIIGDVPGPKGEFTPARNVRFSFEGVGMRIKADSDGHSILLLPLEYSQCLAIDKPGPALFRANLVQTGIVFSGLLDAGIVLHTGAFVNPLCRFYDFVESRVLKVGEMPIR
jgi:hypothetical protein